MGSSSSSRGFTGLLRGVSQLAGVGAAAGGCTSAATGVLGDSLAVDQDPAGDLPLVVHSVGGGQARTQQPGHGGFLRPSGLEAVFLHGVGFPGVVGRESVLRVPVNLVGDGALGVQLLVRLADPGTEKCGAANQDGE